MAHTHTRYTNGTKRSELSGTDGMDKRSSIHIATSTSASFGPRFAKNDECAKGERNASARNIVSVLFRLSLRCLRKFFCHPDQTDYALFIGLQLSTSMVSYFLPFSSLILFYDFTSFHSLANPTTPSFSIPSEEAETGKSSMKLMSCQGSIGRKKNEEKVKNPRCNWRIEKVVRITRVM